MGVSTERSLLECSVKCTADLHKLLVTDINLKFTNDLHVGDQIDIKVVTNASGIKHIVVIGPDGFVWARRKRITDEQYEQFCKLVEEARKMGWGY